MAIDRVLNGPTNDVWIDPWINYLRSSPNFHYELDVRVDSIDFQNGRIQQILAHGPGGPVSYTADSYIAALPLEVFRTLLTPAMISADPQLGRLSSLSISWMTGILFYLNRDVPLVNGHTNYLDSDWDDYFDPSAPVLDIGV